MKKVNQINQVEFYVSTVDDTDFPPHINSWAVILGEADDVSKLNKIISKTKVVLASKKCVEDIATLTARKSILLLEVTGAEEAFFCVKNILKLVNGVVYFSDTPFSDAQKEINEFSNLSV